MKRYLERPGVCQKRLSRLCLVTSQFSVPPQHLNWTSGKWTVLSPFPEYPFNLAFVSGLKYKSQILTVRENWWLYIDWVHKDILQITVSSILSISDQCTPPFAKGGHIPICNAPSPECHYSLPYRIRVPPEDAHSILGQYALGETSSSLFCQLF